MSQSGIQRGLIRLAIVLVGIVVFRFVLAGVSMLWQQLTPFSPVTAMNLIDAFLALVAIGVLWSFRQSIVKQLALVHSQKAETATIAAGVLGLLIVGIAYFAFSYLAWIALGDYLMWIYNIVFLLLAFAASFRLIEAIVFGVSKKAPRQISKRR